jgi:hypothetical protein
MMRGEACKRCKIHKGTWGKSVHNTGYTTPQQLHHGIELIHKKRAMGKS